MTDRHDRNLQELNEALVLAITNIVERWWTDTVYRCQTASEDAFSASGRRFTTRKFNPSILVG